MLLTNEKIKYQIKFESKNTKPENLIFKIDGQDREYKELKDMENELKGEIQQNKKIVIYWEWDYEKNQIQNFQDTQDGIQIKQYNFMIYAIGEE